MCKVRSPLLENVAVAKSLVISCRPLETVFCGNLKTVDWLLCGRKELGNLRVWFDLEHKAFIRARWCFDCRPNLWRVHILYSFAYTHNRLPYVQICFILIILLTKTLFSICNLDFLSQGVSTYSGIWDQRALVMSWIVVSRVCVELNEVTTTTTSVLVGKGHWRWLLVVIVICATLGRSWPILSKNG